MQATKYIFRGQRLLLAVLLGFVCGASCFAATSRDGTPPDMEWELRLEPLIAMARGSAWLSLPSNMKTIVFEEHALKLRSSGLAFHAKYPADPRWRQWLIATVESRPRYFSENNEATAQLARNAFFAPAGERNAKDRLIQRNQAEIESWRKTYVGLRREFFESPRLTDEERGQLLRNEMIARIQDEIMSPGSSYYQLPRPPEWLENWRSEMQESLFLAAKLDVDWDTLPWNKSWMTRGLDQIADWILKAYGWQPAPAQEREFLQRLQDTNIGALQELATGRLLIDQLAKEPMQLAFTSTDGRDVSLERLKGKVVLLQYWATDCRGCIMEIPGLLQLYAKYHDQGFEILGVGRDTDEKKVVDFITKNKMPWPQRVDPVRSQKEYKKYAFSAISNFILLDKTGRLLMYANVGLNQRTLESHVRKELGLPPL